MGLLDNHVTQKSLPMVQMSTDGHIPDQVRLLGQACKVVQRVCGLKDILLVDLEVSLPRWLDNWLSKRLCILFHDKSLYIFTEDLVSIRVVLLVLMEHYLVSMPVVVLILAVFVFINLHKLVISRRNRTSRALHILRVILILHLWAIFDLYMNEIVTKMLRFVCYLHWYL